MRMLRSSRRAPLMAFLMAFMLLLAACGGDDEPSGTPSPTGTTSPSPTATAGDDGSDDDDGDDGEEPVEDLGEAIVMLGGRVITWAPAFYAECGGHWENHGLRASVVPSEGGTTPAIAALVSRDILSAMTGSAAGIGPVREGAPLQLLFQASQGYSVQVAASNQWMEEKGITSDSPLEDRVRAMEGATAAILSPGDSIEGLYRYTLPKYDLDPDTDITMTAMDYPAMLASLSRNQIDVMAGSPPWGAQAVAEGFGQILFNGNEIAGLDQLPYLVGSVNTREIQDNPARVIALLRGLDDAMAEMRADPDAARQCMRDLFSELDEDTFTGAYEFALTTLPESPAISEEVFAALEAFAEEGGNPLGVSYDQAVAHPITEEALGGR